MADCKIKTGSFDYTFSPAPTDISMTIEAAGNMEMEIPATHRPIMYAFLNQIKEVTIKAMILTSDYASTTLPLNLDSLMFIMSGEADPEVSDATGYYYLELPFTETHGGTTRVYAKTTDANLDNEMFVTARDYIRLVVWPNGMTIDKWTPNILYVTLRFKCVKEVVSLL